METPELRLSVLRKKLAEKHKIRLRKRIENAKFKQQESYKYKHMIPSDVNIRAMKMSKVNSVKSPKKLNSIFKPNPVQLVPKKNPVNVNIKTEKVITSMEDISLVEKVESKVESNIKLKITPILNKPIIKPIIPAPKPIILNSKSIISEATSPQTSVKIPVVSKTRPRISIPKSNFIFPKPKPKSIKSNSVVSNVNKSNNSIQNNIKSNSFMIKQGRVSSYISYFEPFFLKTFGLRRYNNCMQACVFFGCYSETDLLAIQRNRNIRIIVWAGSDSDHKKKKFAKKALLATKKMKNVFHISISNYIFNDLKTCGILSKQIPFCINDFNKFRPVNKGKCIYFYTSIYSPETYGSGLFGNVYEILKNKYTFIIAVCKKQLEFKKGNYAKIYPFLKDAKYYPNVYTAYKQCFIGLRLTTHDGNANTVQELGMCGIKCFYNGDPLLKNAIPWKKATDIIDFIEKEASTIGTKDVALSKEVKEYLKPNNSWLDIRNYF